MKCFRTLDIVVISILFTGCAGSHVPKQYTLVGPGTVNVNQIQVDTSTYWSQQINSQSVSWTKDGILLNEVVFSKILEGGDILGQSPAQNSAFEFNPDMSMLSIVELFMDALSVSNFHNVVLLSERPLTNNRQDAVRFKLTYDSTSNVNYTAQAVLINDDSTLYTVYASAPTGYHYSSVELYFNEILESVKQL